MSRTLLIWEWGAGLGHIAKLAGLGRALSQQDRGDIWYACKALHVMAPPDLASRTLMAPRLRPHVERIYKPRTFTDTLFNGGFGSVDTLNIAIRAWRDLYELVRPDLMVFEFAPLALLAARGFPARKVQFGTGWHIPPGGDVIPDYRHFPINNPASAVSHQSRLLANANSALEESDLPLLSRLPELFEDVDLTLLATKAELDHFDRPERTEYSGSISSGISHRTTAQWPDCRTPRILAYVKPFPALRELLHALASGPYSVVVHAAGEAYQVARHFAGPRISIHKNPIRLHSGFPPDLVVSHGGHGMIMESLMNGIPMLLLPQHQEQRINACNAMVIGASQTIDADDESQYSEQFLATIEKLLECAAYRESAERFARKYSQAGPQARTLAVVEKIAGLWP